MISVQGSCAQNLFESFCRCRIEKEKSRWLVCQRTVRFETVFILNWLKCENENVCRKRQTEEEQKETEVQQRQKEWNEKWEVRFKLLDCLIFVFQFINLIKFGSICRKEETKGLIPGMLSSLKEWRNRRRRRVFSNRPRSKQKQDEEKQCRVSLALRVVLTSIKIRVDLWMIFWELKLSSFISYRNFWSYKLL